MVGGLAGEMPTGTVSFRSASQLLGTAPVHPTVPGADRAYLETSSLPAGNHEIVATYSGDDAIEPSSAPPFEQTIDEKVLPSSCAPPNVRTRVLVFRGRNQVRLVARNRGAAPARVTLRFMDHHGRDSMLLGGLTREVAVDGMVRVVRRLGAAEMKRLRRARGGFAADVAIAAALGSCASQSSRPLAVRRLVSGQRVWFQQDSIRQVLPRNTR